jgi:hypothetical protein
MTPMNRFAALCSLAMVFSAAAPSASAVLFDVDARINSSTGGTGVATIALTAGDSFTVTASVTDLWSAGALPRWSNADGLIASLVATGSDDSGQAAGTVIGSVFTLWTQAGFTAPFGSLVGRIGSSYLLLGTSFAGVAPESGVLQLFYWDQNNSDNTGRITADVSIPATGVPDSGGISLLVIGGLAMLACRRLARRTAV